jgi:PEGA domain
MKRHTMWQSGFLACILIGELTGCGTWMHSDKQSVQIFTNPPESQVVIDDRLHLNAPGTVSLSRKSDHTAQVAKDGYAPASLRIDRTWSLWVLGDIFGCLIVFSPFCIMHDIDQGGYYTFDDQVYLTLQRVAISEPPPAR